MAAEDGASGPEALRAGIRAVRGMTAVSQIVILVLTLVAVSGFLLDSVIPYTPAFPIVVLLDSIVSLITTIQADRISRAFRQFGTVARGLAYFGAIGALIMILDSGVAALAGAVGGTGSHVVGPHGSALLLNLSWPAGVISLAAIGFALRAQLRIRKLAR